MSTGETRRKWTADNREKVNVQARAQYHKDIAKSREYNKQQNESERGRARKIRHRMKPEAKATAKRGWRLLRYGLTYESAETMMQAQGGACAICGNLFTPTLKPDVDHCHTSGATRGFLCRKCNLSLGLMGDDPARLEATAAYLRKHGK